jgi:hypothetical protein
MARFFEECKMTLMGVDSPTLWRVADLECDRSWVFQLDDASRVQFASAVKSAWVADKPLLDYTRDDFDLGSGWNVVQSALNEAHHGRGLALVRGLPRDGLNENEFELMNWAIGLHAGVARPQGRASQYISPVRDAGTDYRKPGGRGYSSNARLDFHVDGADLTTLTCYNQARSGGQSMISSSLTAREQLIKERPDLAEIAHADFCFSRQNEQAPDEEPFYAQPLFDVADGRVFCKWNRNRVQSAQTLDGVAPLSAAQRETMDTLDEILQRPELMFTMYLQPGDLQIMNNHVLLHSRTEYIDFEEPARKRLLSRLWLAPPDSVRLPDSWKHFFRSVEPGSVRGGIRGHHHDEICQAFERRQAAALSMSTG